ncbi:MAG: N-acetylmuramoyl-L-alanine amidase [Chitinophagaceae bacterium]|nr:N-acetylmuramoyl-L-alanine amidase [Chitinophagaceae bacterium]MCB9054703.1 N-acetylmuramoyl-L-alanine amidase [Chitinophagales bacterium]
MVRKFLLYLLFFGLFFVYSCTQGKYSATNKVYKKQIKAYSKLLLEYPVKDSAGLPYAADWVGTTNLSMRRANYVIIHHTAQNSCEQTLKTFTLPRTQVSAHYVICKDGTVYHMLNDLLRAHHAGVSKWGNTTDLNSSSIGIELDNNGFEPFAEAQMNSLITLLGRLKEAYNIPTSNFIGHGDIAPTRKIDPNWRFPWKTLAEKGFGYWYDDPANVELPANFNYLQALRIVGFDMKDTTAAIKGFKRHWLQDTTKGLNTEQLKVLYQLSKKYQ